MKARDAAGVIRCGSERQTPRDLHRAACSPQRSTSLTVPSSEEIRHAGPHATNRSWPGRTAHVRRRNRPARPGHADRRPGCPPDAWSSPARAGAAVIGRGPGRWSGHASPRRLRALQSRSTGATSRPARHAGRGSLPDRSARSAASRPHQHRSARRAACARRLATPMGDPTKPLCHAGDRTPEDRALPRPSAPGAGPGPRCAPGRTRPHPARRGPARCPR